MTRALAALIVVAVLPLSLVTGGPPRGTANPNNDLCGCKVCTCGKVCECNTYYDADCDCPSCKSAVSPEERAKQKKIDRDLRNRHLAAWAARVVAGNLFLTDPPPVAPPAPTVAEILAVRTKIAELTRQEAAMVAALNAELAKLGAAAHPVEALGIGKPGHSPVLTWVGDQIAIDGKVTGPHLTGPQGPPGAPSPVPVPPPVTDPLTQALAAAWALETPADKARVKDLANLHAAAAVKPQETTPGGIIYDQANTTAGQIHEVFKASRDRWMAGALPNTVEAIRKWLDAALSPDPVNKPLDAATRDKIAAAFTKVSKAITELK